MTRIRYLAALVLFAMATPASASVRALFVGVDHYEFSDLGHFSNLEGTVNDVLHIKAALQAVYGWPLDQAVAGQCKSANATSITLTDACATRDAILGALDQLIHISAPGDTVIFYYAGHGSQIADSQHLDQPSGWNDTILPFDARDPSVAVPTEILDDEINVIIENANHVQGVNIVTILDSCHSATGARDGIAFDDLTYSQPREAAALTVATRRPLPPLLTTGFAPIPGYRVHFAAAGDGETAGEAVFGSGPPAGVFTTALVAAIKALPGASFADIIEEAQRGTETLGHGQQHPAAEGALDEGFAGGKASGGSPALLLAAERGAKTGAITLTAGSLSGMTAGSMFALYGSWTDARDALKPPLATGHLGAVTIDAATLTLDPPRPRHLPAQLIARETHHLFGNLKLRVRVTASDHGIGDFVRTTAAVSALPFVQIAEPAEILVDVLKLDDNKLAVQTAAGDGIAELPAITDPTEPRRLQDILAMSARVDALLALRTDPTTAQLATCVSSSLFRITPLACPVPAAPAATASHQLMVPRQFVLTPYQPAHLAVANNAPVPRFVYVFQIESNNGIILLTPQDAPWAPGQVQMIHIAVSSPGLERFVVIATDARHPINAGALEQGSLAHNVASCASVLEKLLCQAGNGPGVPTRQRTGAWSAIVTTATAGYSAP